jgi:membrane fusion protein, multidrug efflux system
VAALTNAYRTAAPRWRAAQLVIFTLAFAVLLAGCSKPVEKAEEIRPVRVVRLGADKLDVVAEFPGDVRPRIESRLGFRVGGKIIARKVEIGTLVKRGQMLMQLDPQDLQLAQAQTSASLRAAESNRDLARAELKRYQELREKNFVSQAVLDSKQTASRAAQASYEQALAAYRNQSNQAGYANLVADADGVVTGIDVEVGQVVAAGSPVVRVARGGDRDVVIGIPEDKVDLLRQMTDIRVRTWAEPDRIIPGKLRELSPVADPATRTYAARIAIPETAEDVKLGMTAYVAFASKTPTAMMTLPLTALFKSKAGSAVWIVENGAVRLVPIQVAGSSGNELVVAGGISPGQTVVTAGVNLLKPGQKVKILGDDAAVKAAATPTGNAAAPVADQQVDAGSGK